VHWLELIFDLVMVAYIGQVAHGMHGDPDWADALVFLVLFAAAWWAWVNMTLTLNLFGARITPLLWAGVTVAMVAIGVMAAAVPEALTERAWAFAVGNAVIRLVWMLPWLVKTRTIGVPWWRPVIYSGLPAVLWLVSAVVPPPAQYVLWVVAALARRGPPAGASEPPRRHRVRGVDSGDHRGTGRALDPRFRRHGGARLPRHLTARLGVLPLLVRRGGNGIAHAPVDGPHRGAARRRHVPAVPPDRRHRALRRRTWHRRAESSCSTS
jgi:hypothetical protein